MALHDEVLSDSLDFDVDLASTSMSLGLWAVDTLAPLDDLLIGIERSRRPTDSISAFDAVLLGVSYERLAVDSTIVSDAVHVAFDRGVQIGDAATILDLVSAGLDKDVALSEGVALTDLCLAGTSYSRTFDEALSVVDGAYPWVDGVLQAALSGSSSLTATLVLEIEPSDVQPAVPPRTQVLPRPPAPAATHYVVNPNPHRRL
jgi:hypothetical protein